MKLIKNFLTSWKHRVKNLFNASCSKKNKIHKCYLCKSKLIQDSFGLFCSNEDCDSIDGVSEKWHCAERWILGTKCFCGWYEDELFIYTQAFLKMNYFNSKIISPFWYLHKDGSWNKLIRRNYTKLAMDIVEYKSLPLRFVAYQDHIDRLLKKDK